MIVLAAVRCRLRALFYLLPLVVVLGVLSGVFTPTLVHAQPLPLTQIDAYIQRLMETYQVPGAAIAVIKDGEIVYTKGYGVRNVSTKKPVTDSTLFSIGSISKSFTALAITQLADQGKIKLDDPVSKYIPRFKLSDRNVTKTVTIRQFLTQTSGLPRADDLWVPAPTSRKQIIDDLVKVRLTAKPGEQFQYSNQNYVVLGYLIQQVTGQTWEEYVQQHILSPLDMTSVGFDTTSMAKTLDYAVPHILDERAGLISLPFNPIDMRWIAAHGPAVSLNADILDMARYTQFQLGDGTFEGKHIISHAMLDAMHSEAAAFSPLYPLIDNQGYGMGWFTETYRDYHLVEHSGDVRGFAANITLVPSERAGVVLLTDTQTMETFRQAVRLHLLELILDLKPQMDIARTIDQMNNFDVEERIKQFAATRAYQPDPLILRTMPGDYEGKLGRLRIERQGNRLFARHVGSLIVYELAPFAPDSVLYAAGSLSGSLALTFKIEKPNKVTFYVGTTPVLKRVR
jgi:CubicO group peptidase (beta-lactamase class C family)